MVAYDFTQIETPQLSATDQVFEKLYNAIVSVALPPGAKVSEGEVAKQLGVSRQPVRDAFFRLSNLGFLSIRPQRATLVTQISLDAVDDAVFIRTALEVECLRTALAQPDNALFTALSENLEQQEKASTATAADFHALDEAFHETICNIAGRASVWTLIKEQKAHLDRIRYLTLSQERRSVVIAEHARIVSAVKAGHLAMADTALREHIEGVKAVAQGTKDQHPDYFEHAVMTRKFIAIGECMIEMAPKGDDLFGMGFAGDTFNTAWYMQQINQRSLDVAYVSAVGDDVASKRMTDFMTASGITPMLKVRAGRSVGL